MGEVGGFFVSVFNGATPSPAPTYLLIKDTGQKRLPPAKVNNIKICLNFIFLQFYVNFQ
jgi:hypothetical protein